MQKKEAYKHILPHFQQPGQAYFVTWCLKDSIPGKVVKKYSRKLELIKNHISALDRDQRADSVRITGENRSPLQTEYYRLKQEYFKAFDTFLDTQQKPKIDLIKQQNLEVMFEVLNFWHGKKLENEAFCIMSNHVHWVFRLYEKDKNGELVYLQDIMHSVKRFSANRINKLDNREGVFWQKESFDTTIRNEKHMYHVIEYTLNNPVNAGLVKNRNDWPGNWIGKRDLRF